MKIEEIAYAAGLIDGEGTITLSRNSKNAPWRTPIISMSNTDHGLLLFMKEMFGGVICNQKVYQDHHKQSWSWRLQRIKALEAMKILQPFLREKKKVCRVKFLLENYKKFTPRNGKYTNEMKKRKRLFENAFFLFHSGVRGNRTRVHKKR